ncbi:MAG TPA: hypothetical protein VFL93_17565 [Longimicrobiaceae bacterium]|nr:hypothetical protein [Longimicrobiaceae bacterium]
MITYRDRTRSATVRDELARLRRLAREGELTDCAVEMGELEQGLADAEAPARDDWGELERCLRSGSVAAASALLARRRDEPVEGCTARFRGAIDALEGLAPPPKTSVRVPEGYSHYALDPLAYADAAAEYHRAAGPDARRAVVVGIRSIGTSLSAIVAAAIGSDRSLTVRPRGESGARRIATTERLASTLRGWMADAPDVLVVDEGPGATGETFWCVAQWLGELGFPPERIALLPSHTGGMALAPEARRSWFAAARKFAPPIDDPRPRRVAARFGLDDLVDLSAGRWRGHVDGGAGAPSWTGFERRKFLARDRDGRLHQIRFAGLGRAGAETLSRAERLHELGTGPSVRGAREGFLVCRWQRGRLCTAPELTSGEFLVAVGAYLSGRAGRFATGAEVNRAPILALLEENATESAGSSRGVRAALRRIEALPPREAHIADARLGAQEWLRSEGGFLKTDAVDHGDGLRFPGPADLAWDLAGVAVELAVPAPLLRSWSAACARTSGDDPHALLAAVRAYRPAYAAASLGDASIAAREAGCDADRRMLAMLATRYRRALDRLL